MAKIHFRPYITKQILLFPQRIDENIAEDDPVRLVNGLIDQLDLTSFRKIYKEAGRSPFHPRMMLKAVIYGYMNNVYSCRKIEERLVRDVHFIWLAGYEHPDYITINRFRNRVKKEINAVFTQVVLLLAERGFVSLDVEYIDGTKIESKANKYTFVWRKTVEKNRAKLLEKIRVLLSQIDDVIAQDNASEQEKVEFTPDMLYSMARELNAALAGEPEPATKEEKKERKARQKQVKDLEEKAKKLTEYDQHLETLGERNSYSKTDPDATFMRRKEDAMNNGQTVPCYNLQIGTENQFITDFGFFHNPNDTGTMIPFLSSFSDRYGHMPKECCANSEYVSFDAGSFKLIGSQSSYLNATDASALDYSLAVDGDQMTLDYGYANNGMNVITSQAVMTLPQKENFLSQMSKNAFDVANLKAFTVRVLGDLTLTGTIADGADNTQFAQYFADNIKNRQQAASAETMASAVETLNASCLLHIFCEHMTKPETVKFCLVQNGDKYMIEPALKDLRSDAYLPISALLDQETLDYINRPLQQSFTPAGNASSSALEFYAVFMQMMPLSGMTK